MDKQALDTVVIGAGPAGIGTALALGAVRGLSYRVCERGAVGQTFADWPAGQRFLTPSFTSNGFGATDLPPAEEFVDHAGLGVTALIDGRLSRRADAGAGRLGWPAERGGPQGIAAVRAARAPRPSGCKAEPGQQPDEPCVGLSPPAGVGRLKARLPEVRAGRRAGRPPIPATDRLICGRSHARILASTRRVCKQSC